MDNNESPSSESASILVVEDDPVLLNQLVTALRSKGYEPQTASDGEEGIAKYKAERPNLLIIETILPKMNGAEICVHIRALEEDLTTPILLLGPVDSHPSLKKFSFGTGLFLAKPFKAKELWDAVETLLTRSRDFDLEFDDVDPLERAALAEEAPGASFPLEGSLAGAVPFAALLLDIFQAGRTGILHLKKEAVEKRVFFVNGLPVNADSNLRSEELLSLLRARGELSADAAMQVQQNARLRGLLPRDLLVQDSILSHRELYRWLRVQARDRIANCFGWDVATYRFEPTKGFVELIPIFELNPMVVIDDGLERFFDPDDIMLELYKSRGKFIGQTEKFKRLVPLAAQLFPGVDITEQFGHGRTLGEILDGLSMDPVACQRRMKLLVDMGLLTLEAKAAVAPVAATLPATPISPALARPVAQPSRVVGSTTSEDFELPIEEGDEKAAQAAPIDERLAEQVLADHLRSSSGDAYRVLGVSSTASTTDIESAFAKLNAAYDPDKIAAFPTPDLRAKGKDVYQRVQSAYEAIGDAAHRILFDHARKLATEAAASRPAAQVDDESVRNGLERLETNRFAEAEAIFAGAALAHPGEPLFRIHLAWARYNATQDASIREAATNLLRSAIDELPNSDVGYQYLGVIAQRSGNRVLAEELFKKALMFNPRNAVALQELGFGSGL
ncbi:MAG: response regulator [Deltaproteobacteria bacterium]|nr:response regulator [Deltaproteobacteria bacterium]